VAPPDPIVATAVAGRVGLGNRLVTILAGEGLVAAAVRRRVDDTMVETAVSLLVPYIACVVGG
jgi:NhaP-type Na+/H+ or K+/H+ antiporter